MNVILRYPDNGDDSCKQFFLLATQIELDALPGIKVRRNNLMLTSVGPTHYSLLTVRHTAQNNLVGELQYSYSSTSLAYFDRIFDFYSRF